MISAARPLGLAAAAAAALIALIFASSAPARACELGSAPSTRWTTERDASGVAWLVTPCGERFFSTGVNVIDGGASGATLQRPHYDWRGLAPSLDAWIADTRQRLHGWGF